MADKGIADDITCYFLPVKPDKILFAGKLQTGNPRQIFNITKTVYGT